jgi:predicted dehydrogenase
MTISWGVIGCGGIADRRTIPEGILPSQKCNLAAVMDSDPNKAAAVAQKYGVARHTTLVEEILALPEIQAVYIATPNHLHKEQVIAAARAGKHVLVEKPIALNLADAEEMIAVCRENGVRLMVGYMMRFHAHHQKLKAMIDAGDLGQVVFGRTQLTCWYPPIAGAWRQTPELGGGGAWMDLGSHCLDLLEMWLGPVSRIAAFSKTLTHAYPVDDSTTVLCEFISGAQGVVEANFNVPDEAGQNSLEIRGTHGVVVADHTIGQGAGGHMTAFLYDQSGYDAAQERSTPTGAQAIRVEPLNPYQAEVEYLVDCIKQDREPVMNGELALHNLALILAAYEAAGSGTIVSIQA